MSTGFQSNAPSVGFKSPHIAVAAEIRGRLDHIGPHAAQEEAKDALVQWQTKLNTIQTNGEMTASAKREALKALESSRDLTELLDDLQPQYRHDMSGVSAGKSWSGDGRPAYAGATLADADRLTKDQSFVSWMEAKGLSRPEDQDLNLGKYLKGLAIGDWSGAERERKALAEGTLGAGGHLVPTPLAAGIIDLARNASRVWQAGATTVPMTAQTLKIPRLTGEGTPGWRAENAAIADADMTFDAVTFTARSLNRLVKISVELFEDSDPSAGDVIRNSFAAQLALEIDRVALRGTGTAPEPRGVLNTAGITTTTHGANGAQIATATAYDWHLDAAGVVRGNNFEPNAHLQAPRTGTSLGKLREATTSAYLAPPPGMLPMLPTKQIPTNLTVGTSVDCSEIYTADWNQLMIGIRSQIRIEFLRERYADSGQFAFLAWFRGDVQLAQPSAFVVDTGVRG